jgi:death on curing protein
VSDEESGEAYVYLDLDDALEAHAEAMGCTAREARDRLRSLAALESACRRPAHWADYERADIATQAAVLAHAIAETQPFLDGNKRTALAAMETFLLINGCEVEASDDQLFDWVYELSRGLLPGDFGDRLRPFIRPVA